MFNFGDLLKNSINNNVAALGKIVGGAGHALQTVGAATGAGQLVPGGLGAQLQIVGRQLNPVQNAYAAELPSTSGQIGQVQGASTQNLQSTPNQSTYNPSGGTPGIQTNNGGGTPVQTAGYDAAKASWQNSLNDLNNQGSTLDSSYNQGLTDIQNAEDSAQKAADAQKAQNETDYGNLLKNNLQTYQDTNRQRQGIFSNLGSLDSSEFQNQQFKGDQNFGQNQSTINVDKTKQNSTIDNTLTDYMNQANSGLAQLALTYQSGKNALASARAQGDINGALDISNTLADIRQKAADLQTNANYYKSLGAGVNGSIPNYNSSYITPQLTSDFGSQLSTLANETPSTSQNVGQGWVTDPATGRKINTQTGQYM